MTRLLALLIFPIWALALLPTLNWSVAGAGWMGVLSVGLFLLYRFDKRRAEERGRRVSERTLHQIALCGGWPGALLGQTTFRHKTAKQPFLLLTWTWVGLHQIVACAWIGEQLLHDGWRGLF